jgi:hypothetical protein
MEYYSGERELAKWLCNTATGLPPELPSISLGYPGEMCLQNSTAANMQP